VTDDSVSTGCIFFPVSMFSRGEEQWRTNVIYATSIAVKFILLFFVADELCFGSTMFLS